MNNKLIEFTREALANGVERSEISKTLQAAGWEKADIIAALDAFADVKFVIPVPRPEPYLSAGEVFIYLIMFAALYDASFSLGSMVFEIINRIFADPVIVHPWKNVSAAIRWDLSTLIITFPLFLYTLRLTNKAIEANPARRGSRPRKWLTYLTLFLATMVLLGDVICLVYYVLGGDLTPRIILKAATVAAIAGSIFIYFLRDMRREETI